MELPGAMWIALVVVLTEWVRQWKVGGRWAPLIVLILGTVAKAIELAMKWPELAARGQNIPLIFLFGRATLGL